MSLATKHKPVKKTNYSEIAGYYDRVRGGHRRFFGGGLKAIAGFGKIRDCRLILDIGCGTGQQALAFAKHFDTGIIGVDCSREMLEKAKKKDRKGRVGWVLGNAEHLPFKGGSFDCAYMTFVVHHVGDKRRAFREARRVCRKGGSFVITTSSHARLRRTPYSLFPGVYAIDSARFTNMPKLAGMVKASGFSDVRQRHVVFGRERLTLGRALKNADSRFISTFTLISKEDFERGKKIFEKRIKRRHGRVIDRVLEANFVIARK